MIFFLQFIDMYEKNPSVNANRIFLEPEKLVPGYVWKSKGTRAVKKHLERTLVREILVPSGRTVYYKTWLT